MKVVNILMRNTAMVALLCLLMGSLSVSAQENEINWEGVEKNTDSENAQNVVDTLKTDNPVGKLVSDVADLKEFVYNHKNEDWAFYLSLLSALFSGFALFIAIANHKGMQNMKKTLRKPASSKNVAQPKVANPVSRAEFDDLQRKYTDLLKRNNNNSAQVSTTSKGNSTKQLNKNSQKINQGGQQTNSGGQQSNLGNQQTNSNAQPSGTVKTPKVVENGYFADPIGAGEVYFNEFLTDSQNPNIAFSVEKTENVATFDLLPNIDVREVLSSDYLQSVIDFEGVIKEEANSMSTKLKGKAEFNGEKWIVTKKMIVTLKK